MPLEIIITLLAGLSASGIWEIVGKLSPKYQAKKRKQLKIGLSDSQNL
jgi:hypothetical protein